MRRLLYLLFWLVELPIVVAGALLVAFWFWSGVDTSLASALSQAGRYLPAGHTLVAQDVRGSLREGGHIGLLRWEKNGLSVQARQVELAWRPMALLDRRLQLHNLHVAELTVDDKSPPSGGTPLDELVLPFLVDLTFGVDVLRWVGPPGLQAGALRGNYQFDGHRHALNLDSAQLADGHYKAKATMLARTPMTLDLQAQGKVQAPIGKRRIALDASASLRGDLAGSDAVLDLLAQLRPENTTAATAPPAAAATVSGQISPWAAQPVRKGQASFVQLDLAALWPEAPNTLLTGNAQVQPLGNRWLAELNLVNRLAGPWDTGRLPLDSAKARVEYAAGRWTIQSLNLENAGASIQAQAQLDDAAKVGALSGWQGVATMQRLNPAALHSQLAPARLDGEVRASAAHQGLDFEARVQASAQQPAASALQGLHLRSAAAKGRWADGWLQLRSLNLQTDDAQLQGQLDVQPASKTGRGQLQLALPGAQASVSGQIGPLTGAGEASLQVADAGKATRWLARLPQAPQMLAQVDLQGQANATLRWQGGWQALWSGQGDEPNLQATVTAPRLVLRMADQSAAQSLQLRDGNAEASGRLSALSLKFGGELRTGTRRVQLQTDAQGGRSASGDWQMTVSPLRLQLQDELLPGPWTLRTQTPLTLEWQPAASGATLLTSAGVAELTGPRPGVATLVWQAVRWSTGAGNALNTRGELRGLTMEWLELLADTELSTLGLRGDMVFDANWDLVATDNLQLSAALVRRSGDVRLQPDIAAGASVPTVGAGVREAHLSLSTDGNTVHAALRWDTERAGNAQAEFSTRIAHGTGGWHWPADAPVSATVRARLPQVGAWSMLAPPGWRMRGTLDANMSLSGTRQSPQWRGTLLADELALRSVVDGIEFSNGRLRASMQGQRLFIDEFSLQGAGGAAGGELSATGFALWMPESNTATPGLTRLRIELDARARALRVTARADRRLTVSGTLQARLNNARLDIRGALKADQALFILPDENAPSLGDDVAVRRAGNTRAATTPTPTASADMTGTRVLTELSVALDLGTDFRVQGHGIATRLAGSLQLRSASGANEAPRLSGEVRTVGGTYRGYGQLMDIERGVMRFSGAYDNPALDILAIRPNMTHRVGVQIGGTALSPRVRLYAEPELPEAEKLAWLVLGRSGADGGTEAAVLQQAALALLGRNSPGLSGGLAGTLGLDQLSISSSGRSSGTSSSGSSSGAGSSSSAGSGASGTIGGTTVTVGKRLSRDFYVAYERSLTGTLGTFSIFYDLSRRFTLRARTGEQSAIDLIFTLNYD